MNLTNHTDTKIRVEKQTGFFITAFFVVCVVVSLVGCSREYKFSIIKNSFDLENGLRLQGFEVAGIPTSGVDNSVYGYAWRSWQGIVTSTNSISCSKVAAAIRDSLNKSLNGVALDELTVNTEQTKQVKVDSLNGMLLYNKDKFHGDMHVWLTATEDGSKVNYVVFLREEPLK